MRNQGLVARRIKRRNGLTKQDKTAPKFPESKIPLRGRQSGSRLVAIGLGARWTLFALAIQAAVVG